MPGTGTDWCRQTAGDALGERLHLQKYEAAGEAKHDKGREITELQFTVAGNAVDTGELGFHCRDKERGDDVNEQGDDRVEQ